MGQSVSQSEAASHFRHAHVPFGGRSGEAEGQSVCRPIPTQQCAILSPRREKAASTVNTHRQDRCVVVGELRDGTRSEDTVGALHAWLDGPALDAAIQTAAAHQLVASCAASCGWGVDTQAGDAVVVCIALANRRGAVDTVAVDVVVVTPHDDALGG